MECEDHTLYTGITTDVRRRMKEHFAQGKKGARYTHSRRVQEIRMVWEAESYASAARLEYAIKQLKREDKQDLIRRPEDVTKTFIPALEDENYQIRREYCGAVSGLIS